MQDLSVNGIQGASEITQVIQSMKLCHLSQDHVILEHSQVDSIVPTRLSTAGCGLVPPIFWCFQKVLQIISKMGSASRNHQSHLHEPSLDTIPLSFSKTLNLIFRKEIPAHCSLLQTRSVDKSKKKFQSLLYFLGPGRGSFDEFNKMILCHDIVSICDDVCDGTASSRADAAS